MSYVLHFWESPVPRDFTDAEKIVSELSKDWKKDWKPNPKFTELLRQLAARFPNEWGVFEESELRARETYPLMYVVGIQCIQTEAQPCTVSMANALGLTAYDMQLGKVYLPGGIVFASAGPHTADPGDDIATLPVGRLDRAIDKTLLAALQPLGFSREGAGCGYARWDSAKSQYLGVITQCVGGKNRIEPFAQVGFADVTRIMDAFMNPGAPTRKVSCNLQMRYSYFAGRYDGHIPCQTEAELPKALGQVREFVLDELLPCAERYSDPKRALEAYLDYDENDRKSLKIPSWFGYSSALCGLILARLHGRNHYEGLRRRYWKIFAPLIPDIKEKALKIMAYLDCDPLPSL
jgi:hypothetical protein